MYTRIRVRFILGDIQLFRPVRLFFFFSKFEIISDNREKVEARKKIQVKEEVRFVLIRKRFYYFVFFSPLFSFKVIEIQRTLIIFHVARKVFFALVSLSRSLRSGRRIILFFFHFFMHRDGLVKPKKKKRNVRFKITRKRIDSVFNIFYTPIWTISVLD